MFGSDLQDKELSLYLIRLWWTKHKKYKKYILHLICIIVKLTCLKNN